MEWKALLDRLERLRWPAGSESSGWELGLDPAVLRPLVERWRTGYSWEATRARCAAIPSFVHRAEGRAVHFFRLTGDASRRVPVVLLHGWPSSFLELLPVAERLVEAFAAQHGRSIGLDVFVPSLPGFGLSHLAEGEPATFGRAADAIQRLLNDCLGDEPCVVHGGDFGANVANRLALTHPGRLRGLHVMAAFYPGQVMPETPLNDEEREFCAYADEWDETHGAYMHVQRRSLHPLAYALADSPLGLAAWMLEKYWSWCEFDRSLWEVLERDDVLAQVTWTWLTNTFLSSSRYYAEGRLEPPPARPRVRVPTCLYLTRERVDRCPRAWAERFYEQLDYRQAPRGGHFMAWERPDDLSLELVRFLGTLGAS